MYYALPFLYALHVVARPIQILLYCCCNRKSADRVSARVPQCFLCDVMQYIIQRVPLVAVHHVVVLFSFYAAQYVPLPLSALLRSIYWVGVSQCAQRAIDRCRCAWQGTRGATSTIPPYLAPRPSTLPDYLVWLRGFSIVPRSYELKCGGLAMPNGKGGRI